MLTRLVTKDLFKGDLSFIIKKGIVLFEPLYIKKGLLYLCVKNP